MHAITEPQRSSPFAVHSRSLEKLRKTQPPDRLWHPAVSKSATGITVLQGERELRLATENREQTHGAAGTYGHAFASDGVFITGLHNPSHSAEQLSETKK